MSRILRENALIALAAAGAVAAMSWLTLYGFAWNDYETEALPAVQALIQGHFGQFAALAPAYGGSLLLRAPFALLPGLWGGGSLDVYIALSVPCLIAAAILGLFLQAQMRDDGDRLLARGLVLGLCVVNPITLRAFELGHPEELLGACMCVAAVLLAGADRPLWSALLLGLAIANKEWALLAVGPALLVLPRRHVLWLLLTAAAAAALLGPIALLSPTFVATTSSTASAPSAIFQPWQVFWFLGAHAGTVHGLFGEVKLGYRTPPTWVGTVSHPLILLCAALLPFAIWLRRERAPLRVADSLLLLAIVMLLRCLLDTWDNVYYTLPFLISLTAWDAIRSGPGARRPAAIALISTLLAWASFQWLPEVASADMQAALFILWTVPLAAALWLRLWRATRATGAVAAPYIAGGDDGLVAPLASASH